MNAEIKIKLPDADVEELIGQDPMGELDKVLRVEINGKALVAKVTGYAATNGGATVTLWCVENARQLEGW